MKLQERIENDSELDRPVVDESDWAATMELTPMKMEKQEKHIPPRPPPVPHGGSQKASHKSPKMMLLKAKDTLNQRVAINDTKDTKKKKDGREVNSTIRDRFASGIG